jgi:hypothetical protein
MKGTNSKLAIFETFKTKPNELTGEALRQRSIISHLATHNSPTETTRTAISQKIASDNGIVWKNIYSGIFRDLDEVLVPLSLVEEAGRLPLKRGPKALQESGIPHYQLTNSGLLISLAIIGMDRKEEILKKFLSTGEIENESKVTIQNLAEIVPNFAYSLFERYTKAYCDGKLSKLLPFTIANLKKTSDNSLIIQREFLEGFSNLTKENRDKILDFLRKIS